MAIAAIKNSSDQPNIGIENKKRKAIAKGLSATLADTYTLYLKTHFYHWNVTGAHFRDLHLMFEEQYTELAAAVDEIAERVRALGFIAPGTFQAYTELSEVDEDTVIPGSSDDMVRNLIFAHETVIRRLREQVSTASDAGDEVTVGLIGGRLTVHEKTAWMLRSVLEG